MRANQRIAIPLLIALPVVVLGLVAVSPRPLALTVTWQAARMAAAQERYADAAASYREIIAYQPERTDLWDLVGALAFQAGDFAGAVDAYQQAEAGGALSLEGRFHLAAAYQNLGEIEKAQQTWRLLADQPGLSAGQYAELVGLLRQSGDYPGALQTAEAWTAAYPDDLAAAYAYGLQLSCVDPPLAREVLLPVSAANVPEAAKSTVLLQGLDAALESTAEEYSLVLIGQRLLEVKEMDFAERAFVQATNLNPLYAEAWAMLSEAQQLLGGDGWPALQQARQLNPDSDIVQAVLALYYRRQNQPEQALATLRALAADHPQDARWQIEIGAALTEQGDLIEAMAAYKQATELEPDNPLPWRALAAFAAENGFDAQSYSIPAAQKALELDDESAQSLDLMGWILLIEGDLEGAEQFLQQALQKDASYPRALLHLAQVYLDMNRLSLAYKPLSQAAEQSDDPSVSLQAARLLERYFPKQP